MEVDKNISKLLLGDTQNIQEYIKKNSQKINEISSQGVTYLMAACQVGKTDLINFLIEAGADLDMKGGDGKTALDHAVE
ncbi:protein VAPYRIN-like, partial [Octopus sinensis]|uniref:Protein VAPYRIN-like n=1 Tax=Octopus sinensis TaxID=2607531 RepID=A0A7E6EHQ7_9MOLL